ncbi:hypothetical protein N0V85_002680 [Neurospora sp. IMI 360204]|nr:hypothetical protein N0V85_002680 [Neurospora sp. IMI 360204]
MTLQTSLAAQCIDIYDLDYLQAGLIYLPNIKKYSAKAGREGQYKKGEDISDLPIEKARFVGIYTLILVSSVGSAAYGVSLNERAVSYQSDDKKDLKERKLIILLRYQHLAVPLVLQFLTGAATSSIFTICTLTFVDSSAEHS